MAQQITRAAYQAMVDSMDAADMPDSDLAGRGPRFDRNTALTIKEYLAECGDDEWAAEQDGLLDDAKTFLRKAQHHSARRGMADVIAACSAVVGA